MNRLFVCLAVAVTTGIMLGLPGHSQAEIPGVPVSSFNAIVNLQTDGTADITEDIIFSRDSSLNWTLYDRASSLHVTADGQVIASSSGLIGQTTHVVSTKSATRWSIDYKTSGVLIRHDDRDQFYIKLFENPGMQIYNISVIFNLPGQVSETALSGNIYTIGGTLEPATHKISSNSLSFVGSFAGEKSLFTVSASWPKGVISYSWWTNFKLSLLNLNLIPWLMLGILLPIVCLLVLLDLVHKHRRSQITPVGVSDHIPSNLSPVLAGVLVNKKIETPEIVALIVDLCERGYLVIVKKEDSFSLAKKRPIDNHLESWERDILEQLFESGGLEVSADTTKQLNSQALFSPKVIDAFNQIYGVVTSLEFFTENPHYTRVRYKLIGVIIYLLSATGLIWVTAISSPSYLLIPFAAMMIIAFLILRFSPQLVEYSQLGNTKRGEWVAFGNYLKMDKGFSWNAYKQNVFEKYLPYAVVLGVTKEWSRRFDESNLAIVKPDWFISYGDISIGELTDELVNFTSAIANTLSKLKGPLVN